MDKKKIVWGILFIFIAGFSIWAVVSQNKAFSFESFMNYIVNANPPVLACAILSAFGFVFFEGMAILVILKELGYKRGIGGGMLYSASDIYFSAITPSATGGQPASAYFMMKDGIPGATVTVTLLLNLIMYTTALMTIGLVAVIFGLPIFIGYSVLGKIFIIIGLIVQIALTAFFILLLRKRSLTEKICDTLLRLLKKLHLLHSYDQKKEKLLKTMDEFQECSDMIAGHKGMIIKAYLLNLLQRLCNVCVSPLVFIAGGGKLANAVSIYLTQSYVALGANSVPIPGSMGVSDYLMLEGFGQFMDGVDATQLELLSRSLSFYICILVCSITTLAGYIVIRRRSRK